MSTTAPSCATCSILDECEDAEGPAVLDMPVPGYPSALELHLQNQQLVFRTTWPATSASRVACRHSAWPSCGLRGWPWHQRHQGSGRAAPCDDLRSRGQLFFKVRPTWWLLHLM